VSQQDPACFRRPRKQRRVVRTAEAHILHTNYIEGWVAAEQRRRMSLLKFSSASQRNV
jgi:hypothetical protein